MLPIKVVRSLYDRHQKHRHFSWNVLVRSQCDIYGYDDNERAMNIIVLGVLIDVQTIIICH